MKSPARSRRHETVEPIDFRELLDAPALNGLKEALAHRREPEADIPHFPAPSAIPVSEEITAVELTASEARAAESRAAHPTAGEFHAVELNAVGTTAAIPQKVHPAGGIVDNAPAPESNAVEYGARELTALDSNTDDIRAYGSGALTADAADFTALTSQEQLNKRDTRTTPESNASELEAVTSRALKPTAVEFTAVESDALDL